MLNNYETETMNRIALRAKQDFLFPFIIYLKPSTSCMVRQVNTSSNFIKTIKTNDEFTSN